MSEEVNKERRKGAKQENVTELTDDQLDEAAGGATVETRETAQQIDGRPAEPTTDETGGVFFPDIDFAIDAIPGKD